MHVTDSNALGHPHRRPDRRAAGRAAGHMAARSAARVIRRAALVLATVAAAVPTVQAQSSELAQTTELARSTELAGLEALIEQAIADWEVPGLAIAVVRNDSVILARGFGERELGTGQPVDEHTLFAIASTTKAMTVATLGMLVDEGLLHWDDRVASHLTGLELADPYVRHNVTIRDLLTHRTGVARHDNVWIAAPFDRAEILSRARFLPQANGFRAGYGYNNIMYMAAGEVVTAATGTSWEDFVETRLFEPLGMHRSTARTDVAEARGNIATAHVRQDGRIVPMQRRNYDALGPAGSVFSSAHDMARWLRLHLARGVLDGQRILEESTLTEMYQPHVPMRIDSTARRLFPTRSLFAYGLGWRLEDYHGHEVVQHTGAVNYTRTQVGMIPDQGIGVAVMANLSSSTLQTALMYTVFDALLGLAPTNWSDEYLALARRSADAADVRAITVEAARVHGTTHSLDLEAYTGTYSDDLYGDIRVDLEDGSLVLVYSPDYVADLRHWHHDTFRAHWRSVGFGHAFVTFSIDAQGRASALELQGFTTFTR